MTSYYSSASHFRHPWFDNAVSKRKQPVPVNLNEDMDDEDNSELRPTKKRRCIGLENGIAHLSLSTSPADWMHQRVSSDAAIVEEAPDTSPTGTSTSSEGSTSPGSDRQHILLPGSVEEPSSVPEVQMGAASSWYEPERDRIIITDLDEYAAEDDAADDGGRTVEDLATPSGLNVNPVFLEQLRSSRSGLERLHQASQVPPPSSMNETQALVLFRPLPFAQAPLLPDSEPGAESLQESREENIEDDAMDLDL